MSSPPSSLRWTTIRQYEGLAVLVGNGIGLGPGKIGSEIAGRSLRHDQFVGVTAVAIHAEEARLEAHVLVAGSAIFSAQGDDRPTTYRDIIARMRSAA